MASKAQHRPAVLLGPFRASKSARLRERRCRHLLPSGRETFAAFRLRATHEKKDLCSDKHVNFSARSSRRD
jgi:hypothetical protein